jgi:hypothetical protein
MKCLKSLSAVLAMLLIANGCGSLRTRTGFYEPITASLRNHEFDAAIQGVEAARASNKYQDKDRFLYYIDAGMLCHYASRPDTSIAKLQNAEYASEELFRKSISRAAASLLLNDNVLEYAGEDYEILYTNLINALNYISLNLPDEAFVEIRRANLKLDLLEQKYAEAARELQRGSSDDTARVELEYDIEPVKFHNDAFARYLSMHMYAADGYLDDARIDYDYLVDAFRTQPHVYDFDMPETRYIAADGKAILSVVGLVGLSPVKEVFNLRIRTDKDLDLVQVLYTDSENKESEYGHFPFPVDHDYYFKFAIPRIVPRPSTVEALRVYANGRHLGDLQLIEDVSKVAVETFKAKRSMIYVRSVARAIAKGLAAHRLKKELDTGGLDGWLKKAAVDVATDVSEGADLRCSRFLPGRIFTGDFEIPPGIYDLRIEFLDGNDELVGTSDISGYEVLKKGLNLVEAFSLN